MGKAINVQHFVKNVNKDDANTLISLVVTLIGVSLLVIGWGEHDTPTFTLLGAAVLIVLLIYVVTSKRFKTRPWRDWFPF